MSDLKPLERDAVTEFGIGTAVFAVACVVLWLGRDAFSVPHWWLQVALTGLVIGLVGSGYCLWRRASRAAARPHRAQSNSDLS